MVRRQVDQILTIIPVNNANNIDSNNNDNNNNKIIIITISLIITIIVTASFFCLTLSVSSSDLKQKNTFDSKREG